MTPFQELFEQHAAASLEKQWLLHDLVGDADWHIDFEMGTISFGAQFTFPIQELGTESNLSRTWLWAWANTMVNTSEPLLTSVRKLQTIGMRDHITELTERIVDLSQVQGHQLAMLAAGVCESDGYYRGPYDDGAVFVLFDAPVLRQKLPSARRMVTVFSQLITTFPVNHMKSLHAYLAYHKCRISTIDRQICGTLPNKEKIVATFDGGGRLMELETAV
jgi:hypothetical protein